MFFPFFNVLFNRSRSLQISLCLFLCETEVCVYEHDLSTAMALLEGACT